MGLFLRILDKYLYKELTFTFLAVLIVLLLITFGSEASRLLAEAMQGKVPAALVFQLLLLKIPPALEIILPLVALLAVTLAIGRLYQDQEMVVLQSCAIPPNYFKKTVFIFLLPIGLLMASISLYVSPWSYQQERVIITQEQNFSPITGLVAGKFNDLPNNSGVFYAKNISKKGQLEDIWLKYQSAEQDIILMAPKGEFKWVNNQVILLLEDGYSYQGLEQSEKVTVQQFARFEGVLPEFSVAESRAKVYEKTTLELWNSQQAEELALLQWRIATPLGVLILGLIGLKMSKTGPRQGRFAKIFLAMLIYILFNQLLVVGRDELANGAWPISIGLWPIIAAFALFAFIDFSKLILRSKKTPQSSQYHQGKK